ncbi:hypothetical protein BO94DRAFT_331586 [Aspergillus sclerotioniger CBS 115572]|uniref:Secreted protein n=1 Tax=Aspergillus sclerotioniger CBS 115572 TaxID=1450535 RepID=A0A317UXT1_9EURO|nr:hypothetical protein BO94DRAFT_331586 [Aspergillus sclerotioniger CBS 115572]PWY66853.1 hypothetical protein BO94DRAFT_331586 [Aspergillus sclerotioniger CBS 115572]
MPLRPVSRHLSCLFILFSSYSPHVSAISLSSYPSYSPYGDTDLPSQSFLPFFSLFQELILSPDLLPMLLNGWVVGICDE